MSELSQIPFPLRRRLGLSVILSNFEWLLGSVLNYYMSRVVFLLGFSGYFL